MTKLIDETALRSYASALNLRPPQELMLSPLDYALKIALRKFSNQRMSVAKSVRQSSWSNTSFDVLPISAIFVRPVGDQCNLSCSYCYQSDFRGGKTKRMSLEILRSVLEAAAKLPYRPLSIAWHGGEPLLAGKEFFRRAIHLLSEYFPKSGEIKNSIQTSGVLLDDEWLDIFQEGGFAVGVSLDGPRDLHDMFRRTRAGKGTFDILVPIIERIHSRGLSLNAICVVGERHRSQAESVFRFFSELGIKHCNLQPEFGSLSSGHASHVSAEMFSDFVCDFWDCWKSSRNASMRVRFFDNFLVEVLGGKGEDCVFSGECSRLVAISENGELRPCSRPIRDYEAMGKVTAENASFRNAAAVRFRAEDLASQQRAKDCRFFTMCHQGCPQHRTDADGLQVVMGSNVYCGCVNESGQGYNSIWTHMLRDVEALLSRNASPAEDDALFVESQTTPSI